MNKKPKLHFLRYEFKYIISNDLKEEIEKELNHFMSFDPFVENIPNNKYHVRSLYFDDPYKSFYHEKIDGIMHRKKFRIRTYSYNYNKNVPIFLEIKGRYDNFVYKHRVLLDNKNDLFILNKNKFCHVDNNLFHQYNENNVFKQLSYDILRKRISPIILVDYKRRPYISKYDYNFRLTFDEDLYCAKSKMLYPDIINKKRLLSGYTILEIKFPKHIPIWFHRIIQMYELKRISVSKYCKGIEKYFL